MVARKRREGHAARLNDADTDAGEYQRRRAAKRRRWLRNERRTYGGASATFRQLALDRIRAYGRGDVRAYSELVADGFVHVSDLGVRRTKAQLLRYVGAHGENHATYDIARLTSRIDGRSAIVEVEWREHLGENQGTYRKTDIFTWHENRWLFLRHQETAVWQPPRAGASLDDGLAGLAGHYRIPVKTIDVISVKNQTLFDRTLPGLTPVPLVHVARGVFGLADDPTLVVFLRAASGAVKECLFYLPNGVTIVSHRLK